VGPDEVRAALGDHHSAKSLVKLGEGLDNTAWVADGELIVRVAKRPDPDALRREAAVLSAAGRLTPVGVPDPVLVLPESSVLVFRRLRGTPLASLPEPTRVSGTFAPTLAAFLDALGAADFSAIAERDDEPAEVWLAETRASFEDVRAHLVPDVAKAVEAFLADAPPPPIAAGDAVFCHNDLGTEHVLVDPETREITGVIDWSDAAITDPARDLGRLLRDLDRSTWDTIARGADPQRALFYARCTALEDLAFGLSTGRRPYRTNALAAIRRLLPA
jgi:aminoglycoside phosphotransferase (APT) family kinase protein